MITRFNRNIVQKTLLGLALTVAAHSVAAECRVIKDVRRSGDYSNFENGVPCTFGSDDGPVLPVEADYYGYGYPYGSGPSDSSALLFSPQEQLKDLKRKVIRGKSGPTDGILRQAVNGAFQPLGGRSGRMPVRVQR